jgi:hypothetical protein
MGSTGVAGPSSSSLNQGSNNTLTPSLKSNIGLPNPSTGSGAGPRVKMGAPARSNMGGLLSESIKVKKIVTKDKVKAGGPGSGRRSEGGGKEPPHAGAHDKLTKAGFEHQGGGVYIKGDDSDPVRYRVSVDKEGNWQQFDRGSKTGEGKMRASRK